VAPTHRELLKLPNTLTSLSINIPESSDLIRPLSLRIAFPLLQSLSLMTNSPSDAVLDLPLSLTRLRLHHNGVLVPSFLQCIPPHLTDLDVPLDVAWLSKRFDRTSFEVASARSCCHDASERCMSPADIEVIILPSKSLHSLLP